MNLEQRRQKGAALLAMAEALVAGREAGHSEAATAADNPYDPHNTADQHRAWARGFNVGRMID